MSPRAPQPAPFGLRLPEDWEPEIEKARLRQVAKLKSPVSKHSLLVRVIRRWLDNEASRTDAGSTPAEKAPGVHSKSASKAKHPTSQADEEACRHPVGRRTKDGKGCMACGKEPIK